MSTRDAAPATTAQLKADIDSGRTHDKVASSDPAASPLGTDAEAGGTSPVPRAVAQTRAVETSRDVDDEAPRRFNLVWAGLIAVVAVVFIAGIVWLQR